MGLHPRTAIRDNIVATLKGATAAGDKVFSARSLPVRENALPCISVYTPDEDMVELSAGIPRVYTRAVEVQIAMAIKAAEGDTEAELDSMAADVEDIMDADPGRGGHARDSIYTGTRSPRDEAGRPIPNQMIVTYQVQYGTVVSPME